MADSLNNQLSRKHCLYPINRHNCFVRSALVYKEFRRRPRPKWLSLFPSPSKAPGLESSRLIDPAVKIKPAELPRPSAKVGKKSDKIAPALRPASRPSHLKTSRT